MSKRSMSKRQEEMFFTGMLYGFVIASSILMVIFLALTIPGGF